MQSIADVIKQIVKHVDDRICDQCGSTVKIYERIDREGNKHINSHCMTCDNNKLRDDLPRYKDLDEYKLRKWIKQHELVDQSISKASIDNYVPKTDKQQHAKRLATGYVKKFSELYNKHSLVFKGDVGLGKSHLSYAIAKELRAQGKKVMFLTVPDLMNAIKSTYSSKTETQETFIKNLEKLDLLILDDIGAEYVKQDPNGFETWAADVLFQVINARQSKPTIYSTNYTSADMQKKYGKQSKRILSRMLSGAEVIELDGLDQRIQNF